MILREVTIHTNEEPHKEKKLRKHHHICTSDSPHWWPAEYEHRLGIPAALSLQAVPAAQKGQGLCQSQRDSHERFVPPKDIRSRASVALYSGSWRSYVSVLSIQGTTIDCTTQDSEGKSLTKLTQGGMAKGNPLGLPDFGMVLSGLSVGINYRSPFGKCEDFLASIQRFFLTHREAQQEMIHLYSCSDVTQVGRRRRELNGTTRISEFLRNGEKGRKREEEEEKEEKKEEEKEEEAVMEEERY
ncbi:hypothetical protein H920_12088 [Fukomys damarensis]|uniref:Uncharacterized protein n=1 Tax=Fukomys damarensis TaxID=885580 RepID=A0A091D8B7_FUKDA|nr:hypothetical protein H920_12088 [Fukomys damarensis]